MSQDDLVEFQEVVRRRRMVRQFAQRPVERGVLERIFDTARRGPSAGFSQGFEFVVLDTPEQVKAFWTETAHPEFHELSKTRWTQMLKEGRAMRKRHGLTWSQVFMAGNTPILLRRAMVEGDSNAGVMASGQVVGVIDDLPTVAELLQRITNEAEETLARLGG